MREALPFLALPLPLHQRLVPLLVVLPQAGTVCGRPRLRSRTSAGMTRAARYDVKHTNALLEPSGATLFNRRNADTRPGRGQALVADVQGVHDLYTDPQILSPTAEWGAIDMGCRGIVRALTSHICTPICHTVGAAPFHLSREEVDRAAW